MSVIIILISISTLVATGFLIAFIWAVRSGQYEDTDSPAIRILMSDRKSAKPSKSKPKPGNHEQ